jgi:hypothetical protein
MDEAGIGWRDNEQYDSFDALAAASFRAFVIDSLEEEPEYLRKLNGYVYDQVPHCSPSGIAFIVEEEGRNSKFVRLSTSNEPFDTVVFERLEGEEGRTPVDNCRVLIGKPA